MKTDAYKRTTAENRPPSQKKGFVGRKRLRRRKKQNICELILPSILLSASLFCIGIYFGKKMSTTDVESEINIDVESHAGVGKESQFRVGEESHVGAGLESHVGVGKESHVGATHPGRGDKSSSSQNRIPAYDIAMKKKTKNRESFKDFKGRHNKRENQDIMDRIGDKSLEYERLRKYYDKKLPLHDIDRMKNYVQSLRKREYLPIMKDEMSYDIHDCPSYPPDNYPLAWNVSDVIDNWTPDDTTPRSHIYQGICVFDFDTEHDKAMNYREAELPFIVRDDPQVLRTAERWNQPEYMEKLLGDTAHRTEYSSNNHFMYWSANKRTRKKRSNEGWTAPTKMLKMPYQEWLAHANITDESKLGPDMEHWYYRLIGCGAWGGKCKGESEYLFDELTFFQPRESLYMTDPSEQKGIHCRFGMKGVIAGKSGLLLLITIALMSVIIKSYKIFHEYFQLE